MTDSALWNHDADPDSALAAPDDEEVGFDEDEEDEDFDEDGEEEDDEAEDDDAEELTEPTDD